MAATRKAGLEIGQDRVDPPELGQLLGLSAVDDGRLVIEASFGHGVEASQTIRQDRGSRCEVDLAPLGNGLQGKTGHEREFGAQGVALLAQRNDILSNERRLSSRRGLR